MTARYESGAADAESTNLTGDTLKTVDSPDGTSKRMNIGDAHPPPLTMHSMKKMGKPLGDFMSKPSQTKGLVSLIDGSADSRCYERPTDHVLDCGNHAAHTRPPHELRSTLR
jgi:hypothetical protein